MNEKNVIKISHFNSNTISISQFSADRIIWERTVEWQYRRENRLWEEKNKFAVAHIGSLSDFH